MKRAKFKTPEKQREYFLKVKEKLNIGAKELSKKLGLKSRGQIESYTFMRTSPPVEIIKKIEEISGINADYETVEGKVYRKKRKFITMNPGDAEVELIRKFGDDFNFLQSLIKSKMTIKTIVLKIRERGYSFDNCRVSRWIGAYRMNLLVNLVEEIIPTKEDIIIGGHIREDKNTLSINFNLAPLYHLLENKEIYVGLKISRDRKKIRIIPLNFGRKLIRTNRGIKILLTEKSELKVKTNVQIILNPQKFGFSLSESIYDNDAKSLVKLALKEGFILDSIRSTPFNHKGDLSLYIKNKNILIEITRASSYKSSYFKIGQCFVQKLSWPKSIQFLVCKEKLLSQESINAIKKLNINIIYTNFEENWEQKVMRKIKDEIK